MKSFELNPTNDQYKEKYELLFRNTILKKSKTIVNMMVKELKQLISKTKEHEEMNFVEFFREVNHTIIFNLLFGPNFIQKITRISYKDKDGRIMKLKFTDALTRIQGDCIEHGHNLTSVCFPWINKLGLIEPYKTDSENIRQLYLAVEDYLTNEGTQSILDQKFLGKEIDQETQKKLSTEALLNEIFNVLDSGPGALMFSIASCLLLLKRHPEVNRKLRQELQDTGFIDECKSQNPFQTEKGKESLFE